jgi:predicted nucleic-acid-binding Zn-ribbon protein
VTRHTPCPECGASQIYRAEDISAGGGYAPNYLPGLGKVWRAARFDVLVCRSCGFTRWFARAEARQNLAESKKWKRV